MKAYSRNTSFMITTIHTQMHRATDLAKVCRPWMDRAIETSHNPSALATGNAHRVAKKYQGGTRFT